MWNWIKKKPIVEVNFARLLDLSGLDEHEDRIIDIIKSFGPLGRKSIYWKMYDLHIKEYRFCRGIMCPINEDIEEAFARLRHKSIIQYDKHREVYFCENMSSNKVDNYSFMNALVKKHWAVFSSCEILDYMN